MGRPQFLSFAGLDDRTDLDYCAELSAKYPIEWAFLWSTSRAGNHPRYPSTMLIERLKEYVPNHLNLAIHLCGDIARRFNGGEMVPNLRIFNRIQVNLPAGDYDEHQLDLWGDILDKPIITQWREPAFPEPRGALRHFLYDVSGGRGHVPTTLPVADDAFIYGYAGGITPENVVDYNAKVDALNYYLDMESGIRTDEWLDLAKCEAVCESIYGDMEYPI